MADKKIKDDDSEEFITSSDLDYILEVNKKAIEINIEVEKQNEQVLSTLENLSTSSESFDEKLANLIQDARDHKRILEETKKITEDSKKLIEETKKVSDDTLKIIKEKIEKQVEEIEKSLFRLIIILGSAGIGAIVTIIQSLLHK